MDLDTATYTRMRWNTPLSDEHAARLLARLEIRAGDTLLDLGCGWGELLLRAVAAGSAGGGDGVRGVGVDTDSAGLLRGQERASRLGLADRVTWVNRPAAEWNDPASRVLCVGASHALDGAGNALRALREITLPGGRLLFGEGCWERAPTPETVAMFPEVLRLADLVDAATRERWRVLHVSSADQREWDDFESTWRLGRQEWLLANPDDPDAADVRATLDRQLAEYVGVYRGVLGFCYLVLAR